MDSQAWIIRPIIITLHSLLLRLSLQFVFTFTVCLFYNSILCKALFHVCLFVVASRYSFSDSVLLASVEWGLDLDVSQIFTINAASHPTPSL